jgi:hypothetical protein
MTCLKVRPSDLALGWAAISRICYSCFDLDRFDIFQLSFGLKYILEVRHTAREAFIRPHLLARSPY